MRKSSKLIVVDENKQIILSLNNKKCLGWHTGENGEIVDEIDENQIEICYKEADENGWGVGGNEFFSTADIKAMADCIRSVIYMKRANAKYSCQNDFFRMELEYDSSNDTFTFTAALVETLTWEHHITVTKTALTRNKLDEYIRPFFEWEKDFPIISN